jgi:hypothetical protein
MRYLHKQPEECPINRNVPEQKRPNELEKERLSDRGKGVRVMAVDLTSFALPIEQAKERSERA